MPDSLTVTLVQRFWREGLYQGHATRWQQIIERLYKQQNLNMKHLPYIYAVTLRHVSEINAARLLLSQFISQMGQVGDFVQQGWALLESAIILRSQGSYETALSHIDRARGIGINWRSPELARAADMERSQILLDVGKAAEMYAVLESIPRTNRVIFLEIEGYLSLNMPERALSLLVDNFALFMHSPDEKVSAHMLLGRCYDRLGRLEEARYHFQVALILLEKAESGRLLGRAQANMGALLIKLREYSEAYRLLRQAEALQKQTEDRVTIAAIQHNFRILNSRTAN
jgi:tetratricopeptide (TPR) repeat protein